MIKKCIKISFLALLFSANISVFAKADNGSGANGNFSKEESRRILNEISDDYKREVSVYCKKILFGNKGFKNLEEREVLFSCFEEYGIKFDPSSLGSLKTSDPFSIQSDVDVVMGENAELDKKINVYLKEEMAKYLKHYGTDFPVYDVYDLTPKGVEIVMQRFEDMHGYELKYRANGDESQEGIKKKKYIYRKSSDKSKTSKTKLFNSVR